MTALWHLAEDTAAWTLLTPLLPAFLLLLGCMATDMMNDDAQMEYRRRTGNLAPFSYANGHISYELLRNRLAFLLICLGGLYVIVNGCWLLIAIIYNAPWVLLIILTVVVIATFLIRSSVSDSPQHDLREVRKWW